MPSDWPKNCEAFSGDLLPNGGRFRAEIQRPSKGKAWISIQDEKGRPIELLNSTSPASRQRAVDILHLAESEYCRGWRAGRKSGMADARAAIAKAEGK